MISVWSWHVARVNPIVHWTKPQNTGIFATCSKYRSPYELPVRVLPKRFFPLPIFPLKVFSSHECRPSFTFQGPPTVSPLHNFNFQRRPCQRELTHGNLFNLPRVNNSVRWETRNSDVVAHHLALSLLPHDTWRTMSAVRISSELFIHLSLPWPDVSCPTGGVHGSRSLSKTVWAPRLNCCPTVDKSVDVHCNKHVDLDTGTSRASLQGNPGRLRRGSLTILALMCAKGLDTVYRNLNPPTMSREWVVPCLSYNAPWTIKLSLGECRNNRNAAATDVTIALNLVRTHRKRRRFTHQFLAAHRSLRAFDEIPSSRCVPRQAPNHLRNLAM